ncbi:MAG: hypothetical protein JO319_13740 [Acidobacteriaceae bacterium]|nr:hypothetical protein [Acidobacteriaceae bacterium]
MASSQRQQHANGSTERTPASAPSTVDFVNTGDQNQTNVTINLPREQWTDIIGALSIAAGEIMYGGDFVRMFRYTNLCQLLGARLGYTSQVAQIAEPPPQVQAARA